MKNNYQLKNKKYSIRPIVYFLFVISFLTYWFIKLGEKEENFPSVPMARAPAQRPNTPGARLYWNLQQQDTVQVLQNYDTAQAP